MWKICVDGFLAKNHTKFKVQAFILSPGLVYTPTLGHVFAWEVTIQKQF